MPNSTDTMIRIGLLNYPGALVSAVHGLSDMFSIANLQAKHLRVDSASLRVERWMIADAGHICCDASGGDEDASRLSVVVIPPTLSELPDGKQMSVICQWLRSLHAGGTLLASVCGGAYILAETGLVSGRTITTHWLHGEPIKARHPSVHVDTSKLLIDEGDVITAGGMMAWVDLGLTLVDRFLGADAMLGTARYMVVDPGAREQRCYSGFNPRLDHGDAVILDVQHWLHGSETKRITLGSMADRAKLTERTFLRRFRKATGVNPSEYCQRLKMARSRDLLGMPGMSLEEVGRSSGYEDPKAYRQVFKKVFGLSPAEYRMRFSAGH